MSTTATSGSDKLWIEILGLTEVRPLEGFSGIMGEVANLDVTYASDTDLPTTLFGKCPRDRSGSFVEHRQEIAKVLRLYRTVTEHSEKRLWLETTERLQTRTTGSRSHGGFGRALGADATNPVLVRSSNEYDEESAAAA